MYPCYQITREQFKGTDCLFGLTASEASTMLGRVWLSRRAHIPADKIQRVCEGTKARSSPKDTLKAYFFHLGPASYLSYYLLVTPSD